MKILLVALHPYRSPQSVPLACAFLKEALQADPELATACRVEIAEFLVEEDPARVARAILAHQPDLVGFSVYVWNRDRAVELARLVREEGECTICAGGPEPSAHPLPLQQCGAFDFLVQGEGENALVETVRRIVAGRGLAGIPGLLLAGEAPGPRAPLPELDRIPSPYLSGTLDPATAGGALWQLSRGCDFACAFCFDHKGAGGVRRFAVPRLEAELKFFAQRQVPQVFVLDSTFNKIPQRAKEILRLIAEHAPQVHFHFEVRSEFIDREMAELFASITCSLQIGLQSAHPKVLAGVGRTLDPADFQARVGLLNQTGAIFGFDLIYGLPGDSLKRFCASLDFALELYPNHLDLFPLAVLPGTRLYGRGEKLGLRHLDVPPYTVTATPEFPASDLARAAELARACDLFYSRGKAVAWFNPVLAALKLSASSFLTSCAQWLAARGTAAHGEEEFSESEIWGVQRDFLQEMFRRGRKERLLPLALDLADYHHHYACALLASPPEPPAGKTLKKLPLLEIPLKISSSVALCSFHYEILELLEAGMFDLAEFARHFQPETSQAAIYPAHGEVRTESLSLPYFRLLAALDGRPAQPLARRFSIPTRDLVDFLRFALEEGIVTFA